MRWKKAVLKTRRCQKRTEEKIAFYVALHYAVVEVIIAAVSQLFIAPTNEFPA